MVTLYCVHIKESALPTLTKDKERIHEEIAVSVIALCHYLQGREGMDDVHMREMFSKVR